MAFIDERINSFRRSVDVLRSIFLPKKGEAHLFRTSRVKYLEQLMMSYSSADHVREICKTKHSAGDVPDFLTGIFPEVDMKMGKIISEKRPSRGAEMYQFHYEEDESSRLHLLRNRIGSDLNRSVYLKFEGDRLIEIGIYEKTNFTNRLEVSRETYALVREGKIVRIHDLKQRGRDNYLDSIGYSHTPGKKEMFRARIAGQELNISQMNPNFEDYIYRNYPPDDFSALFN